jgi:phosphatidylserine/phosphatidylglycerophosphate/cardiolipin synthase-like enzyme
VSEFSREFERQEIQRGQDDLDRQLAALRSGRTHLVYLYDTRNPDVATPHHTTNRFHHGKVVTVDGVWTSIGTANADNRSMQQSQEINLNIDSPAFAEEIERRIFQHDIKTRSREATPNKFSPFTWPIRKILEGLDHLARGPARPRWVTDKDAPPRQYLV